MCDPWSNLDMTNTECPDFSSHQQNAVERLFPNADPNALTVEQGEAVDAEAEAEYRCCEGH